MLYTYNVYTRQKKKVVQLKNSNISQKTFHYIVDMPGYAHIHKAYPISNLFMGQTSQNIKWG